MELTVLSRRLFGPAIILVLLLGLLLLPATAQDVGSGGIGGRPAYPREDNDRTKSIFVHTLEPGDSAKDGINIINNSEETKKVAVYATDALVSSGGAFACEQAADEADETGSWVVLEKNSVTLASSESQIVDFTITVPRNADVGEHDACLVVQEESNEPDTESGIGLSFRTAIRTAVLVPGDIIKSIEFTGLTSSASSNSVILTPMISNTGNVSVDANISTYIKSLWGQTTSVINGEYPVLRGETGEWNFSHTSPFWGGWYQTEASATYNENPQAFLGEQSQNLAMINIKGSIIFVKPQLAALAIELGVLLLVIYVVIKGVAVTKRRKDVRKNWKTYTVKTGMDIKKVAKLTDTDWRRIARANRLKPPYTLETGQKLKLPPNKKK